MDLSHSLLPRGDLTSACAALIAAIDAQNIGGVIHTTLLLSPQVAANGTLYTGGSLSLTHPLLPCSVATHRSLDPSRSLCAALMAASQALDLDGGVIHATQLLPPQVAAGDRLDVGCCITLPTSRLGLHTALVASNGTLYTSGGDVLTHQVLPSVVA